jgi:hypothetical protein
VTVLVRRTKSVRLQQIKTKQHQPLVNIALPAIKSIAIKRIQMLARPLHKKTQDH